MQDILSKNNFIKLSEEVHSAIKKLGWWRNHGFEIAAFALRILVFVVGFFIFAQKGVIAKILGIIVISYGFYAIGITGTHETRHGSFLKSGRWNKLWAYFFSDFWAGQSNQWWHWRHVQVHHVFTNVPDKEPKQFYFPWINRYVYFFIVPFLVTLWLFVHSVMYLWKKRDLKKLVLFLLVQTAGWLFHISLFNLFLSLPLALLATFVMRSLFAPIFVHLAVFNHIGLEDPRMRLPWLPHQTRTTRNLKPNWFLLGIGGNAFVNCHIEHHLFPHLSNHLLSQIRPIVVRYLKKEGYVYVEETYFQCLRHCLKHYHTIFKNEPVAL